MSGWTLTALDRQSARELQTFLPDQLFDAHAHLYRRRDLNRKAMRVFADGPADATAAVWRREVGRQVGAGRLTGGLFIPIPSDTQWMDAGNDFLAAQLKADPSARGLILIAPSYPRARVEHYLEQSAVVGFKPYHLLSGLKNSYEAPLSRYLPEWAWAMAHERRLVILLHLVRARALSDPGNRKTLCAMCAKYPAARLVLAHAARGFHAPNTVRGLAALRGLENVWFDSSGICEPEALEAILNEFGPRRLMWGSDFPISQVQGRCATVGDAFVWLQEPTLTWKKLTPACQPLRVGLESLRALQTAAERFGLDEEDRRDVFGRNAQRLLGLLQEPGTLTQDLYRAAKQRIPGGVQLLSKRPEMFAPDQWPAYYREARGCEVWDLDGRHYYDLSINGIGACLLGFRDPDVTRAVRRRINLGGMSSLNPPDEVAVADLLCQIHPWAEQARFTRTGGECAAVAVRIARATTDRSLVAICGYHGWQDWYLAANLGDNDALRGHLLPGLDPFGVPGELRGSTLPFKYNDRQAFQAILERYGDWLAAVVMEPCRFTDPEPGFLEFVRDGTRRAGGLLIYDEITIGWRLHYGGAHLRYGVHPDIAIFAKSIGNGHPMAAIIGTASAMEGAHKSFISSSFWTEAVGPAAALATLRKMQRVDVPVHVARMGALANAAWQAAAQRHRLPAVVEEGFPCMAHFKFDHAQAAELKTLYAQLMLERGFLAGLLFYPTLAHTEAVMARYAEAIDAVFARMAELLAAGQVQASLKGPVAHGGFRRLL